MKNLILAGLLLALPSTADAATIHFSGTCDQPDWGCSALGLAPDDRLAGRLDVEYDGASLRIIGFAFNGGLVSIDSARHPWSGAQTVWADEWGYFDDFGHIKGDAGGTEFSFYGHSIWGEDDRLASAGWLHVGTAASPNGTAAIRLDQPAPVPLPAPALLLLGGLGGFGLLRWRSFRSRA